MNQDKKYFQEVSEDLEALLKQYKNTYPRSLGAIFRVNIVNFIILVAVFLVLYCIYSVNINRSIATLILCCVAWMVGLLSILYAIFEKLDLEFHKLEKKGRYDIYKKRHVEKYLKGKGNNKKEYYYDPTLLKQIKDVKSKLDGFYEYPDVKKYLEQYDRQVKYAKNKKKRFRFIFAIICVVLISVQAAILYLVYTDSTHPYYSKVLNIDENVPFLSLEPLDLSGYSNVTPTTYTADIYIDSDNLRLDKMKVSGATGSDILRLVITDTEGIPVPNCPKFVFPASQTEAIKSEVYCSSSYEALDALNYMNENKANLRFVIEKL